MKMIRYDRHGLEVPSWRFDVLSRIVVVRLLSAGCFVRVCSPADPRAGAHPIERIDARTWSVRPEAYYPIVNGFLEPRPVNLPTGPGELALLDAPEDVVAAFVALAGA